LRLIELCDRVLLRVDGLPATISISENVREHSPTDRVSVLISSDYQTVDNTNVAINPNPKTFEVIREARRWKVSR